ncbi:unnamed protein product [Cylicocyclus nassatus]|uniref:Uncharacterized protein n=1 Tax=Cylicocyclus nassatus TaxID=53992 RepID=A0AA36GXX9_CYLNA|nr:unnamed protein product [Cylicocyclus nassatus]
MSQDPGNENIAGAATCQPSTSRLKSPPTYAELRPFRPQNQDYANRETSGFPGLSNPYAGEVSGILTPETSMSSHYTTTPEVMTPSNREQPRTNLILTIILECKEEISHLRRSQDISSPITDVQEFKYENLAGNHILSYQKPFKEVNLNEALCHYTAPKRSAGCAVKQVTDFLRNISKEICDPPYEIWDYTYRATNSPRGDNSLINLPEGISRTITEFIIDAVGLSHPYTYSGKLASLRNSQERFWKALGDAEENKEKHFKQLLRRRRPDSVYLIVSAVAHHHYQHYKLRFNYKISYCTNSGQKGLSKKVKINVYSNLAVARAVALCNHRPVSLKSIVSSLIIIIVGGKAAFPVRYLADTAAMENAPRTPVDLNVILKQMDTQYSDQMEPELLELCREFREARELMEKNISSPDFALQMTEENKEEYMIADRCVSRNMKKIVRLKFRLRKPKILLATVASILNTTASKGLLKMHVYPFKAWNTLEKAEHERELALKEELIRQEKLKQLAANKKREAIETDIFAYEERVQAVVALQILLNSLEELEAVNFYGIEEINRKENLLKLWNYLFQLLLAHRVVSNFRWLFNAFSMGCFLPLISWTTSRDWRIALFGHLFELPPEVLEFVPCTPLNKGPKLHQPQSC